jgi:hypothetical protein
VKDLNEELIPSDEMQQDRTGKAYSGLPITGFHSRLPIDKEAPDAID